MAARVGRVPGLYKPSTCTALTENKVAQTGYLLIRLGEYVGRGRASAVFEVSSHRFDSWARRDSGSCYAALRTRAARTHELTDHSAGPQI